MREITCAWCGNLKLTRHPWTRFCSTICKNEQAKESHKIVRAAERALRPDRACRSCGIDISHRHATAKWCSESCAAKRPTRKAIARRAAIKANYGITEAEYEALVEIQGFSCAICGGHTEDVGPLVVDHDHSHCSGRSGCRACVRGLLCGRCNCGLGMFRESPFALRRAVDYLNPAARSLAVAS